LNLLALSDIHGETRLVDRLADRLSEADVVLLAGDITNFGGRDEMCRILDVFEGYTRCILAVHGNCDLPAAEEELVRRGLSVDGRRKHIKGVCFTGIGGSLPCIGRTPSEMEESVFTDILDVYAPEEGEGSPLVFLSHQPPYGTKIDRISREDRHGGSRAIRRFIEERGPVLAVSGHVHESRGLDKVNQTVVVNPGPFRSGNYAVVEIQGGTVDAKLYHI